VIVGFAEFTDRMRGEVVPLGPLERARLQGEAAERAEQAEADQKRLEAAERAEFGLLVREAAERAEISRQGYSNRELAEYNQRQAAEKRERIDQLERELRRLRGQPDPDKPVARSASRQSETDRLLARARQMDSDGVMRRMVEELHQRQAARASAIRRSQADELERPIGRGDQATIRRVCGEAGFTVY
jgi:hypothetical protein